MATPSLSPTGHLQKLFSSLSISPERTVLIAFGVFICLGIGSACFRFLADTFLSVVRRELEKSLQSQMTRALLEMSWPHFLSLRLGDLSKSILMETFQIGLGSHYFLEAFGSIVVVGLFVGFSFLISVKLTLYTLLFGSLGAVLYRVMSHRSRKHVGRLSLLQGQVGEQVSDIFGNLKFFRASGKSSYAHAQIQKIFGEYSHSFFWTQEYGFIMHLLFESGAVIFIAGFLLINQHFFHNPVSSMLIFLGLFYRITPRFLRAQDGFFRARTYLSYYFSWDERRKKARQHQEQFSGKEAAIFQSDLAFHAVSFSYPDSKSPAISELNIRVKQGECVAIVGVSGSGKSTFLDLILGLLLPTQGFITIDEVRLNEIDFDSWRLQIGLVPQESPIFYGTFLENITWAENNPDHTRAERAAKLAHAWSFIESCSKGLDAVVGEKGGKLSGGQRQRLAIARALYRNPSLLVLDEATSALDSQAESHVLAALEELKGKFTMLIVAHRVKTVQMADRICVLDQGRLIEEGTWQGLIAREGSYLSRMALLQGITSEKLESSLFEKV